MLKKIYAVGLGTLTLALLCLNTLFWFIPFLAISTLKFIPHRKLKQWCSDRLHDIAVHWTWVNNKGVQWTRKVHWEVNTLPDLSPKQWYLVIANHQSWLDIVVLQKVFNRKIPFLKFFIKDQLKWLPILGFVWWVLDYPFMKRYSKEYLKKHPEKKGRDLKITQDYCQKFKNLPISVMNFVEGTRFNIDKKIKQQSPYEFLLNPKAGGVALVLNTLSQQINHIIDVTIVYPQNKNKLWLFLCGRVDHIKVHVRKIQIPQRLKELNYFQEEKAQQSYRQWLNQLWLEKDNYIKNAQFKA